MEVTFNAKAIILRRQAWRERDSKITVYCQDLGKLELVARGTSRPASKLAGHIEPISLSDIMVVRGKQYNYIGSAVSENCFSNIKNNLNKLQAVGQGLGIFNQAVKPEKVDQNLYNLLKNFFNIIDQAPDSTDPKILLNYFILKLLARLGYKPELYHCQICRKTIQPQGNRFDCARGGLVCSRCQASQGSLTISENCIKILRLALNKNFEHLGKIKISPEKKTEIEKIVSSFYEYNR